MDKAKKAALFLGTVTLLNLALAMSPGELEFMPFVNLAAAIYGSVMLVRLVRREQRYAELFPQYE